MNWLLAMTSCGDVLGRPIGDAPQAAPEAGCAEGRASCDGVPENGCEVALASDPDHCGGCGVACPRLFGTAACTDGACALACDVGFGDCDGLAETGCETPLASTPSHCGACGHDCLGGTCTAGVCDAVVLATALPGAVSNPIRADGGHLYFCTASAPDGFALARIDTTGKGLQTAPIFRYPLDLAFDATHAFVLRYESSESDVLRIDKEPFGAAPASIGVGLGMLPPATGMLEVDASGRVFWFLGRDDAGTRGDIRAMSTDGSGEALLAASVDARGLAVDDVNVYWVDSSGAWSVPKAGGAPTQLGTSPGPMRGIAVDADAVYWTAAATDTEHGGVTRWIKATQQASLLAIDNAPHFVMQDGASVFWTSADKLEDDGLSMTVRRAAKASGATSPLLQLDPGLDFAQPIRILDQDDDSVFVHEKSTGRILRVAK